MRVCAAFFLASTLLIETLQPPKALHFLVHYARHRFCYLLKRKEKKGESNLATELHQSICNTTELQIIQVFKFCMTHLDIQHIPKKTTHKVCIKSTV